MRIAVVGATGVLGRSLIPLLCREGARIRALARSPLKARGLFGAGIETVECDLLFSSLDSLTDSLCGCDAVVHIATAIPKDPNAPGAWEANTRLRMEGTKRLLNASIKAGLSRYVQQSIVMAYQDHGDGWITEDAPLDDSPRRAWLCAPVLHMENLLRGLAASGPEWCILRGGRFVGPDTFQDGTIDRLRSGQESVAGDGNPFISLIHVEDMASAVALALGGPSRSIFNVVDEPLREGEYLDRLADAIGAPHPARDPDIPMPPSWRCSARKARESLGWKPIHSIFPDMRQAEILL